LIFQCNSLVYKLRKKSGQLRVATFGNVLP